MKIYLTIISLLITGLLQSQHPEWEWAQRYGGTGNENGMCVHMDKAGYIYFSGQTYSPQIIIGNDTLTKSLYVQSTGFLVKKDTTGNILWTKMPLGNCRIRAIVTDSQGNVIITGAFYDYVNFDGISLSNYGSGDIFFAKYDSLGNIIWAKKAGGVNADWIESISVDSLDNIYATGNYGPAQYVQFGSIVINNWNNTNLSKTFVCKYDSAGTALWVRTITNNCTTFASKIAVDAAGNSYATGIYWTGNLSNVGIPVNQGEYDIYFIKYNTSGHWQWGVGIGGTDDDFSYDLVLDNDSNLFFSGRTKSSSLISGSLNHGTHGINDFFMGKITTSGNLLWIRNFMATTPGEYAVKLSLNKEGSVFLGTTFKETQVSFGAFSFSSSVKNVILLKLDQEGFVLGGVTEVGAGDAHLASLASSKFSNSVYLLGHYSIGANFDTTSLICSGLSDLYLAKIAPSCKNASFLNMNPCYNYTVPSGDETYYSPGVYFDTIPNIAGCDSILIIDLDLKENSSSSLSATTCSYYKSPSGKYYTTSGIYSDTIQNNIGCDSIISISLIIKQNCVKDKNNFHSPLRSSNSSPYLTLFPNPAKTELNIHYISEKQETIIVKIYDAIARKVMEIKLVTHVGENINQLDISALFPGIYFVEFKTGDEVMLRKIVVE